ncbi:MAG: carboxypeptidase-like regulatory domain-containing protein [Lachnospiraceae bacterium]|nr:carboxypeptidase-like regulatory domain-containing protein [Lachnospiraceae bacterium]
MKKAKKERSILTAVGFVIYTVILAGIIFGSYILIKNTFIKQEAMAATLAEKDLEEEKEAEKNKALEAEKKASEKVTATPTPTPKPTAEIKEIDLSKVDTTKFINGNKVDYSVKYFKPGKRDTDLKAYYKAFSNLENINDPKNALINTYGMKRLLALNEADKNLEYLVYYKGTDEKDIGKITLREDCGGYFRISDFYYEDGRIKYADEYEQAAITPKDLSGSDILSRYYFNKDRMAEYIYCDNSKRGIVYKLSELKDYSEGTVKQYDYLEETMLNKAYITYYASLNLPEEITLSGYVLDESSKPLKDVSVKLMKKGKDDVITEVKTNDDGFYSFGSKVDESSEYVIDLSKDTLEGVKIYGIQLKKGSGDITLNTVYMGYTANLSKTHSFLLVVRNARDSGVALEGAKVNYRKGVNNKDGDIAATGTLDSTGSLVLPLPSDMYTAEIVKEGYETAYLKTWVSEEHISYIGYSLPDLPDNSYAAVVYWEDKLFDIDSRVIGQYGKSIGRSSVDSIGSIMAEVLDITDAGDGEYGMYLSDYGNAVTGNGMVYALSESNAVMDIYSGNGYEASFKVPAAYAGTVWNVCTIRKNTVIPENKCFYNIDKDSCFITK